MKEKMLKRLNELLILIVKADDKELNNIGKELLKIEAEILDYKKEKIIDNIKKI